MSVHGRLREAHAHLPMYGRELTQLSLAGVQSTEECLEAVRGCAAGMDAEDPSGARWLLANGARIAAWERAEWPTRAQLDAICATRPVAVMSFDHHSLVANTAAMRCAGLAEMRGDPEGGVIERDERGSPTGLLLEGASWLVRRAVPEMTGVERLSAVRRALAELAALGFVEVDDLMSPPWLGSVLAELERGGELPLRVGLYPLMEELEQTLRTRAAWESERVVLKGGKLFADGTLNSRTAWVLSPYRGAMAEHPCGTALLSVEQLRAGYAMCEKHGLECAVHAIGDGAVRACLDAKQASGAGCRVRIEHCELVDERDVGRFAALGVVASVQPCHLLYDIEILERVLPHRLGCVLPLKSMIASGLRPGESLVFGSDVPIVRPEPGDSVEAAVWRRRVGDGPAGGASAAINVGEAIDEATAWRCFGAATC